MKKKKIGIVCYPTFGGSGVVATELGKALAAKGHEIHFITYNQPFKIDELSGSMYYHEVRVSNYPLFDYAPYELALTSKLVDVVRYEKLDLLHVHYAIPHASAAYMAKQILKAEGITIPYITTLHGTDITLVGKDPSFEPVITFAINHSDRVTAVSQDLKNDTLNHFKVHNNIEVIPNFICLDEYNQHHRQELRKRYAPNNEKIIMHISNFRKVKRVEDVILLFTKLAETENVKLIMIGDGPERIKAEMMCRDLKSCDKTLFMGKIKNTESILSCADLFVLPSETESFGLSALEAMASYVPVISTNTGGMPELNVDGFSGYLCNVGDVDDMHLKAMLILKDEKTHEQFRLNARKRAEDFDIIKILPLYEKLYESL